MLHPPLDVADIPHYCEQRVPPDVLDELRIDPTRGSEGSKRRPAVIVSNDAANRTAERLARGVVTVAPVTTNPRCLPSRFGP